MAVSTHANGETLLGAVSASALTVGLNIGACDILKTVILAIFSATASFLVSRALKWLISKLR